MATGVLLGLLVLVVRLESASHPPTRGVAIVNDGDTLTLNGERIRLRGIDAPELFQTCQVAGKDYPCGRASRDALTHLVAGRAVTCSGGDRDKFNRRLGQCRVGNLELNARQVEAGWAVAFGDYLSEENAARSMKLGIWAGEFDAPSDWRATHGRNAEPRHDALAQYGDRIRGWFSGLFGHK